MKNLIRTLLPGVALLVFIPTFAFGQDATQQPAPPMAQLVLSGNIKVNGKAVSPGVSIASGDQVTTGPKSSAVVSLGKLGRVEVLPSSEMKVSFDDMSLNIDLDAGAARVTKAEGKTASVATKDGAIIANSPRAGSFVVDMDCGNTIVTSTTVAIDVRSPGDDPITISPGNHASIGTPRPRCKPRPIKER